MTACDCRREPGIDARRRTNGELMDEFAKAVVRYSRTGEINALRRMVLFAAAIGELVNLVDVIDVGAKIDELIAINDRIWAGIDNVMRHDPAVGAPDEEHRRRCFECATAAVKVQRDNQIRTNIIRELSDKLDAPGALETPAKVYG